MIGKIRKTLRFQIGAIVSLVLAILLMAFISMHMVSVRYDREVLADKQEKLKVISEGLSSGVTAFIQRGQSPGEIRNYFDNQVEGIVDNNPRLIVGLYLPDMGMHRYFGEWTKENHLLLFRNTELRNDDEFFKIKVSSIRQPKNFTEERPGVIFMGRAEPVISGGHVKGAVLIAEQVQSGLAQFRMITRIIFILVPVSLIAGIVSTVWVLARLKRGVRQITSGLAMMANDAGYRLAPPASDELAEISIAINKMADVVEHKALLEEQLEKSSRLAALGQLVAGVAHEIRNPLGIMKATVQVMKDEFTEQEIQEYLAVLNEQVDRQNNIIRELLDYAKPVPPIFQSVKINDILKSLGSFSKLYFQQHKVDAVFALAKEPPLMVNADVEKLKQAFLNIIFNAVEAMPDGGELKVSTALCDNNVIVEFQDTGRGIPQTDIDKLFDPFFTTKNTGTGLGLATVHKVVEMHGGRIEVNSEVRHGTVFRIFLPVDRSEG